MSSCCLRGTNSLYSLLEVDGDIAPAWDFQFLRLYSPICLLSSIILPLLHKGVTKAANCTNIGRHCTENTTTHAPSHHFQSQ